MFQTKKIVLVGDEHVGKTQFCNKYVNNKYKKDYNPTLGCEVHPLRFQDKIFNIWDCAGQERFKGLGEGYYVQANGFIIMIDVSSLASIEKSFLWEQSLRNNYPNIPIIFVLNKSDLLTSNRKEFLEEKFANKKYFYHSNVKDSNISSIFNVF